MKHLLLSLTLAFSAGAHASAPNSALTLRDTAVMPKVTIALTGATSKRAAAPLMLALNGAKAQEPSFELLAQTAKKHREWVVQALTPTADHVRLALRSKDGTATLGMDADPSMIGATKLAEGSVVTMETQKLGTATLLRIMKDKVPLGFMASEDTQPSIN